VDKGEREAKQVTSNDPANRPCNRVNAGIARMMLKNHSIIARSSARYYESERNMHIA